MLNIEGMSAEAKIGKILILVSVVLGILAVTFRGLQPYSSVPQGGLSGFWRHYGDTVPGYFSPFLALKIIGVTPGIGALYYSGKNELTMAGILATLSSVLAPLDLITLIGGIFCLISKEANSASSSMIFPAFL
jgi:hypothetical protein